MFSRRLTQNLLLIVCLSSFVVVLAWHHLVSRPISHSPHAKPIIYFFKPGFSSSQLAADLHAQGVLDKPRLFLRYIQYHGLTRKLQAGAYQIEPTDTIVSLAEKLSRGDVLHHDFTIVEGWTIRDLLRQLAIGKGITGTLDVGVAKASTITLTTLLDKPLQKQPSQSQANIKPETIHAEGLFLPETYRYPHGFSERQLLQFAHDLLMETVSVAWSQRDTYLPYRSWYDALIVASLVEKETSLDNERRLIAGVIVNRLRQNMLLQIDATVIYGMGNKFIGDINKQDLRTATPYNTYTHRGLPPTPIAMPGIKSIEAALHPAKTPYLYFVAKGDDSGSHYFSKSLDEHNAAVRRYLLRKGA